MPVAELREVIPVGLVRIFFEDTPLCDVPEDEVLRMLRLGSLYWDDEGLQMTQQGRAYLEERFRN